MRFFLHALAAVSLAVSGTLAEVPAKTPVINGTEFGGRHGTEFSDYKYAQPGVRVKFISINGKERLDGITMIVQAPGSHERPMKHGGDGGHPQEMVLDDGEFINMIDWYTNKRKGHTRVYYLEVYTNRNRTITAGTPVGTFGSEAAPTDRHQLAGWNGQDGDEIDLLQAIWACRSKGCL